jgi:hypothetical protein
LQFDLILKVRIKFIICLVVVSSLFTCIDPYVPKLKGYDSLLVVDGLITDENTSYTVRLSRTMQNQNASPTMVSDADVFIIDDAGNNSNLNNKGNGIYKTDSLDFTGIVGRTYSLHITTKEGNEYVSDPCVMQSVPDIDSIYYARDQELTNNGTQSQDGLSIYLDSKAGDNNQFFRWAFEEAWEFKVPFPKKFNFDMADSSITSVDVIKDYCWKSKNSDEILIYSNYSGQAGPVKKELMTFIASDQSDRLTIEYSMLVKQYSISKNEYDFWDNLKQVNENGGDIFASQPFPVISNIHNLSNPKEKVLGYFQVSAVKEKRIFIPFSEIVRLQIPLYHYDQCKRMEIEPSQGQTWDDVYMSICVYSDYYFIEPVYYPGTDILVRMTYSKPECANCELTGTRTKPNFWVDLN